MKTKATLIIAEAGVNHNGCRETAKQLIDVAAESRADLVKFQTFKADTLVSKFTDKAEYQKKFTDKYETSFEMIKKLELDRDTHEDLILHCEKKGISFLSTAFDHASIELLDKLNLPFFKIPSGEITNLPHLRHIGRINKPILMSTGMATLEEVQSALSILLEAGAEKNKITILHCNTEYPTPMQDANLNAMLTIRDKLGVAVGYSDHTLGIEVPIAAVAMGATVIEKHFTLSRKMEGPDHRASLEPDELTAMVQSIRNIEKAMGNGVKQPSPSEKKNIPTARKSLVAATTIRAGETFTEENMTVKRPGTGISPMLWDEVHGTTAIRDFLADDLIEM